MGGGDRDLADKLRYVLHCVEGAHVFLGREELGAALLGIRRVQTVSCLTTPWRLRPSGVTGGNDDELLLSAGSLGSLIFAFGANRAGPTAQNCDGIGKESCHEREPRVFVRPLRLSVPPVFTERSSARATSAGFELTIAA